ncbi:MAG: LicD family protein [Muribaculaceae bacterium]|nr:LicD family protein [Muribaculaceae bacterium]
MIDQAIQNQLRTQYNPEGSPLRQRQLRMLEMLKFVDRICTENNIKYWLSSGTCLGAVRHHGFIPWDDDVDIELLEDDYNKLIKILRENETDEFVIQSSEDDPNYIFDFAKLRDKKTQVKESFGLDRLYKHQGLFIDIFKLVPSNSRTLHYISGRMRTLENYLKLWAIDHRIVKFLFPFIRKMNNSIFKVFSVFDKLGSTERLRHTLGVPFLASRFYNDIFDIKQMEFEDSFFPVPRNYHKYLTNMFGDYMQMKISHTHLQPENAMVN